MARPLTTARSRQTRTLWLCGLPHGFTHLYTVVLLPLLVVSSLAALPCLRALRPRDQARVSGREARSPAAC